MKFVVTTNGNKDRTFNIIYLITTRCNRAGAAALEDLEINILRSFISYSYF